MNAFVKSAFFAAMLTSTVAAQAATVQWGNLSGFNDGDLTGSFDLGASGSVSWTLVNPPNGTFDRATNDLASDIEDHPGFTSITGDLVHIQSTTPAQGHPRIAATLTFDFSGYTGAAADLVLAVDHIQGNSLSCSTGCGGTDILFDQNLTLLSDLQSSGVFTPVGPGFELDVTGNTQDSGDFLFGGINTGSVLTLDYDIGGRDGTFFSMGVITADVPAPGVLGLFAAALIGLGIQRKRMAN